ncbi:MAG TPA: 3-deoxy-7-phosphoheptulonate synthase [Candidatus Paceibacterota bacterium]|nr:3-deoxy-7-phosphoheptulonate synthase [Candidatus Paceibacterota bacterium]
MNGDNKIEATDVNIKSITKMPTPDELKEMYPLSQEVFEKVVYSSREAIKSIISGEDKRFLVFVGPCSIHNVEEAYEYAKRLKNLQAVFGDKILIVMRVCLDKPRSGRGWAGFFQDPGLNQSRNIDEGWKKGRELLIKILELGIPVSMELLDADACQNVDDCISYWWIGARTVTSQRLREIASGLSTPVGFKNPTNGKIADAIDAMETAWHEAAFIATSGNGNRCEYRTYGNKYSNLILRGSDSGPNYGPEHVADAVAKLVHRNLPSRILIDVSHANSGKDYRKQREVIADIGKRVAAGESYIAGFLYESYLEEGNQKLPKNVSDIKPNISVTDGCDSFETTQQQLQSLYEIL